MFSLHLDIWRNIWSFVVINSALIIKETLEFHAKIAVFVQSTILHLEFPLKP